VEQVEQRQAVVAFFSDNPDTRLHFLEAMQLLPDLERLMCRCGS